MPLRTYRDEPLSVFMEKRLDGEFKVWSSATAP